MVRSAYRDAQLVSSDATKVLPVGKLSVDAGGTAFQLTSDTQWTFSGSVVVVENAEPFWQYEKVIPEAQLAVYASGNMSARLVDWLVNDSLLSGPLIHWGDYDPRGTAEYLRLADRCTRVTTFVPPDIDTLLERGQRKLLLRQARILESLRARIDSPHVTRMVALFDKHHRALEQEALLTCQ